MIALGLDCIYSIYLQKKYLKLKNSDSLSEVHFNTGRFLFEFNGRFVAGQIFVAFTNPVSVSFG